MKFATVMSGALLLSLFGTGCATKKYVAQTVAPVETRVSGTEAKNTEQDKQLGEQKGQIEEVDRDLSHTKEMLKDTDQKATAAGAAAQQADQHAVGAQRAADGARTLAQQGIDKTTTLERTVDGMNKFQMAKSDTVLFAVNKFTLSDEAKAKLDAFAKSTNGVDRYIIEVQGYTDKTGGATYNDRLSQERAEAVARYLANQYQIPLRNITLLGSGIASGDQKTREERKELRKVDVRMFVPETASMKTAQNSGGAQ